MEIKSAVVLSVGSHVPLGLGRTEQRQAKALGRRPGVEIWARVRLFAYSLGLAGRHEYFPLLHRCRIDARQSQRALDA